MPFSLDSVVYFTGYMLCQQIHTPKTNRNDHGSLSRRDSSEALHAKTENQTTFNRKHTTTTNAVPNLCIQSQKHQRFEDTQSMDAQINSTLYILSLPVLFFYLFLIINHPPKQTLFYFILVLAFKNHLFYIILKYTSYFKCIKIQSKYINSKHAFTVATA